MYKAWAEDVEGKAIDTLRNCLSMLLNSLSDNMKIKPEFTKDMTKQDKLKHLMAILDEQVDAKPPAKTKVMPQKKA